MNILGIRFRARGQTYFFSAAEPVPLNSTVVVETEQGIGIGVVISAHESLPASIEQEEIRPVLRLAQPEDLEMAQENEALSKQALTFCQDCIRSRKLDMKLVDVEVYYDRTKIIFYFTAPARIDFRELVKDLVREYRSRIELRQIGVRHETQMVGAVGNCGMVCCCRRFLRKFAPVTIRMAKEQNLFLNPAKISGICGRLLCCLSYEQDNYDDFHHNCPRLGKKYQTTQGNMKVLRANMFRNTLSVLTENNEELEFSLDDWKDMEPHRPDLPPPSPQPFRVDKSTQPNDGMLVFSITPETVDDPELLNDMLHPDLAPQNPAAKPFAACPCGATPGGLPPSAAPAAPVSGPIFGQVLPPATAPSPGPSPAPQRLTAQEAPAPLPPLAPNPVAESQPGQNFAKSGASPGGAPGPVHSKSKRKRRRKQRANESGA